MLVAAGVGIDVGRGVLVSVIVADGVIVTVGEAGTFAAAGRARKDGADSKAAAIGSKSSRLVRKGKGEVQGISVIAENEEAGVFKETGISDERGEIIYQNVPPGVYKLWLIAPPKEEGQDGHTIEKKVGISSGETKTVRIDLDSI